MPFNKGLDPQISQWIKISRERNSIRQNADKKIYVCNQIKYKNQSYWQDDIKRNIMSDGILKQNSENEDTHEKSGKTLLSLDAFKERHEKHKNKKDFALLIYSINCRQNDFLNILIQSGNYDINEIIDVEKQRTMIHLAVLNTDFLRVKYLISKGADINASDYKVIILVFIDSVVTSIDLIIIL